MRIWGLTIAALLPLVASAATFVVDTPADSGPGSLREAIVAANSNAGPDTISFNILPASGTTILLQLELPSITDPVTIDGLTQPSGIVEINGLLLNVGNGLQIQTDNCLVRALALDGFDTGNAILINGGNNNTIQGCLLGIDATTTNGLPNLRGIQIVLGNDNHIGGSAQGQPNFIVNNTGDGVSILSGTGNSILGNSIFNNTGLGINLSNDTVTANDPGDTDTGPNNFQNFPVLTLAGVGTTTTTISGTLNSLANRTYRLEFFDSSSCAAQGQIFLGSANVTADANGNATFNVALPVTVNVGDAITATATDAGGNTSEFSDCVIADVLPCQQDITPFVEVRVGKVLNNARLQRFFQRVTIVNTTDGSFDFPPLNLVLDNLTTEVTAVNAKGITGCAAPLGSPFVFVTSDRLASHKRVRVVIEYTSTTKQCITFTPRVLAGGGQP